MNRLSKSFFLSWKYSKPLSDPAQVFQMTRLSEGVLHRGAVWLFSRDPSALSREDREFAVGRAIAWHFMAFQCTTWVYYVYLDWPHCLSLSSGLSKPKSCSPFASQEGCSVRSRSETCFLEAVWSRQERSDGAASVLSELLVQGGEWFGWTCFCEVCCFQKSSNQLLGAYSCP